MRTINDKHLLDDIIIALRKMNSSGEYMYEGKTLTAELNLWRKPIGEISKYGDGFSF